MTNHNLAAQARTLAAAAQPGSLDRRAAGVLAIALHESRTIASARRILAEVDLDDVRAAADELLDRLTAEDELAAEGQR